MLNLFLALLLASFGSNVLAGEKEDDENKIDEAIERLQRWFRSLIHFILGLFLGKRREKNKISQNDTCETIYLNEVRYPLLFSLSFHFPILVIGYNR